MADKKDKTEATEESKEKKPGLFARAEGWCDDKMEDHLFLGSVAAGGLAVGVTKAAKPVYRKVAGLFSRGSEKAVEAIVEEPMEEAAAEAGASFLGLSGSSLKLW